MGEQSKHTVNSIDDLKPAPYNPRDIKPKAAAGLAASLKRYGDVAGIVWNKRTGHLVCGHQRVDQLRKQGAVLEDGHLIAPGGDRFAVRVVDWPLKREKEVNAAANNPHIGGEFTDGLGDVLADIKLSLSDEEFSGLRFDELGKGLFGTEVEQDEVPDPPKKPVTKLGDVWELGRHRVVCGDAATVKHDSESGVVFTSPPYAQQRDYTEASDVSDWDALMRGVFGNLPTAKDAQVLVNLGLVHHDGEWLPYWEDWIGWMRKQGWRRFGWYVWDKGEATSPRGQSGRLPISHEWIFHFCKTPVPPDKTEPCKHAGESHPVSLRQKDGSLLDKGRITISEFKSRDSVFRCSAHKARNDITEEHPARMSVSLAAEALKPWPGDVYDPFLGSGTTLIAAEQLDRVCYGVEIEPRYVDVCIARWENLTNGKAKRLSA